MTVDEDPRGGSEGIDGTDGIDRPDGPDRLDLLREEIRRVDGEIIRLVAERVRIARDIGMLKRDDARATLDPGREAAVIRAATALGRQDGLDPEAVRELFWTLVGMCRRAQLEER